MKMLITLIFITLYTPWAYGDFQNLSGAETANNIFEINIINDELVLVMEISTKDVNEIFPDFKEHIEENKLNSNVLIYGDNKLTGKITYHGKKFRKKRVSPFAGMKDPRTGLLVPDFPRDKVYVFEAVYKLNKAREVSIIPPLNQNGISPISIGFTTSHGNIPVNNFSYLTSKEVLYVDYSDPWNTSFLNRNMKRYLTYPISSYLYVKDDIVSHEYLVRLKVLYKYFGLDYDGDAIFYQDKVAFLGERDISSNINKVSIDNKKPVPDDVKINFLYMNQDGFRKIGDKELSNNEVLVAISRKYYVSSQPNEVLVIWEVFEDKKNEYFSLTFDSAGYLPSTFSFNSPEISWVNYINEKQRIIYSPVILSNENYNFLFVVLFAVSIICIIFLIKKNKLNKLYFTMYFIFFVSVSFTLTFIYSNKLRDNNIGLSDFEKVIVNVSSVFNMGNVPVRNEILTNFYTLNDGVIESLERLFLFDTEEGGEGNVVDIGDFKIKSIMLSDESAVNVNLLWKVKVEARHWGQIDSKIFEIQANIGFMVDSNSTLRIVDSTLLSLKRITK
ncbi:hypothetical protein ACF8CX_17640 [Vibrio mimicus]